ncbi:MAG TPA: translocation/assembly module TamB domain-containing protein [Candidatus Acidoferrales bacterium]|nr:translocation/assembly module TamB domain-containing protein [Candidatus Acidoferrales bacterium]
MRKRFVIGLVAAVLAIGIVIAKRHELVHFAAQTGVSLATGYTFNYTDQLIGGDHSALIDVHVSRNGYPVLDARRIDVWYSLRDLLPGSSHRFGLTGVAIDGAKLTVVHFKDGTYNIDIPQGKPSVTPTLPLPVNPVPVRFTLRMENAQMELVEPYAYDASAKDVKIHDFNVTANIDSSKITGYGARGAFFEHNQNEPFTIAGKIDSIRGYAMHHAKARFFPLRALANYFSDTAALKIIAGRARNFDARVYSLDVQPNLPSAYHVNLQLDLAGAKMVFQAIAAPIENIRGHLELVDNDVFVRGMTAELAGVPMRMTGGLYDLSSDLTGSAQLRLGVDGTGELSKLRNAFTFTQKEQISGVMSLGVLVQGPLDNPMIVAHGHAVTARYRAMPLNDVDASIIYRDGKVGIVPLLARYAGTNVTVRGTLDVSGKKLISDIAVHADVAAQHLPYLDELLANEPLVFDAVATGSDLLFHVNGAFASARGTERVAGLVTLDPNGTGRVVPFWLHTERGNLDGGYVIDRPSGSSAFWAVGSNLTLHAPSQKAFPGIDLPVIPKIDGQIASFTAAGGGSGKNVEIAGTFEGRRMAFAGVPFDAIHAAFGGTMDGAAVNLLQASGPWGRFDGNGAFSGQAFVARGHYRGTLDGLQPFLGKDIPGHGPVEGTAGIEVVGSRIIVQGQDLRMPGATLRGVPISRASITLAVDGDTLDVYSAHATAAGGDIVAAGRYSTAAHPPPGGARSLSLVAMNLDAAQLHGIGLPIDSGRLTATGNLAAGAPLPTYHGGVSIAHGSMQHYAISGNADVDLAGDGVHLGRTIGALGSTYAYVDGRIDTLSSGEPTYGLNATIPAGNVAATLHALSYPNYMTQGSFNAKLHVGGRGSDPRIDGAIGVPGGNVNGLPFVDVTGDLAASVAGVSFHHGRVQIGTTRLHFTAIAQQGENAFHVASDRADLSDFNNFFDTGDTLDGNGTLRLGAFVRPDRINTSGNIDIRKFRYRNLPIGDTRAAWSSQRNNVTGDIAIGGDEGAMKLKGTIGVVPSADIGPLLTRSHYDLSGSVENLDLSLWVPALGFQSVPITGRASGEATLNGRYPALTMRGDARIDGGTLGPLTLDTAKIALHSNGTRVTIDSSQLVTPGLQASAAGSFGLKPADKLDLQVHAATDDLPRLVYQLARVHVPVTGSFESTLQIAGTMHTPSLSAGFDATDVQAYGISVASAFGEVKLRGTTLVLSDAGASFAKGEATLAGSLPLELSPLRVGPADQPISFDVDLLNVDPAFMDVLLGSNTKLGGTIDGHMGISGKVGAPEIRGHMSLENGSYTSDLERTPIVGATATLTFNRTSAQFTRLFARLGNGTVSGAGSMQFPDGFSSTGNLAFDVNAHAKGAQLDIPAYGKGTLDADVTLKKRPAQTALLSGAVALSNAALPFSSFLQAAQSGAGNAGPPLPLAFDLQASAGKNVRVRGSGYGAGLDIGAAGSVKLGGTLAAPTLAGTITSTGGTLTYFDKAFRVQNGNVTFDPADGVLPNIHAVAVANVNNPDPDKARNPYGTADITIAVDGPIEGLKISFTSQPAGYTQDQIIALLAPFGGLIANSAFNNSNPYAVQSPGGFTPLGAVNMLPPGVYQQRGATLTVGQEAFNILNAQFAAGLLSPVENALGQGLGLSSVNLTLGYYGSVGFKASRELTKTLSAIYGVTFGIPQVQTFGLQYSPSINTSASFNIFTQTGGARLFQTTGGYYNGSQQFVLGQPIQGGNGFSVQLTRNLESLVGKP